MTKPLLLFLGMILVAACAVPPSRPSIAVPTEPRATSTVKPTNTPKATATTKPTNTPRPAATVTPERPTSTPRPASTATPVPAVIATRQPIQDVGSYPCQPGQIKGNRNSGIYHAPGQRDYAKTQENVQCFNTEGEALAAGYRKALR